MVTALLIERSGFELWPGTLPCVLRQDTTLTVPLSTGVQMGTNNFDARDNPALDWHLSLHDTETRISSFLTWLACRHNLAIHHPIFLTCLIDREEKNSFSSLLLIQAARPCQYQSQTFLSLSGLMKDITDNGLKCQTNWTTDQEIELEGSQGAHVAFWNNIV